MKPIYDLQWATDDVTTGVSGNPNKLEPFDFKSEGQQEDQPVPRQYLNFQFDAIRQWKDYLEDVTDSLLASSGAALQRSLNLSDLTDISVARTNLGLSNVATLALASQSQAQSGTSDTVVMTPLRSTDHFNSRTTSFTRTILSRSVSSEIRSDLGLGTAALANTGDFASSALVITAGNGLTGGGNLTTGRTITLGTPSTITSSTTNSVSAESHSHAISLTANDVGAVPVSRSITAGNGLTGGGALTSNLTLNVGGGDGISVGADSVAVDSTVVRTTGSQSIGGTKTFTSTINGSITGNAGTVSSISSFFANKSLTTNGYQVFDGGFTIMWGQATVNGDGVLNIGWPTNFNNVCLQAVATLGQSFDNQNDAGVAIYNITSAGATLANGTATSKIIRYIALGF